MLSLYHVISERMEVTPMIDIDPHNVYHFGYPLFLALPHLTTTVNSFDDLKKNRHFFNQLQMLHKLFTHYIVEGELRMEF